MSEYAKRDHMQLDREGGHYSRHVSAMTAEGLHAKSDIAGELAFRDWKIAALLDRLDKAERRTPIDMVLNCPACGLQHIDAPDERTPDWKNEPHRSHLCHGCGHIWRPADVPTNGVAAIKTKGKADSPIARRPVAIESMAQRVPLSDEQIKVAFDSDSNESYADFVSGVLFAEQAHGIGSEK